MGLEPQPGAAPPGVEGLLVVHLGSQGAIWPDCHSPYLITSSQHSGENRGSTRKETASRSLAPGTSFSAHASTLVQRLGIQLWRHLGLKSSGAPLGAVGLISRVPVACSCRGTRCADSVELFQSYDLQGGNAESSDLTLPAISRWVSLLFPRGPRLPVCCKPPQTPDGSWV